MVVQVHDLADHGAENAGMLTSTFMGVRGAHAPKRRRRSPRLSSSQPGAVLPTSSFVFETTFAAVLRGAKTAPSASSPPAAKPLRNGPCRCGSGKKSERCCAHPTRFCETRG
jgi:hypothetical protein